MSYDHMVRRRTKNDQRFFYDGYLQVCNFHSQPQPSTSTSYFIWDCTEKIATRPLAWQRGNSAAHYEYAPFGAVIICRDGTSQPSNLPTPQLALANPWRFSSEYSDDELGCVYYNYRHYEPVTGRGMSWDPMEEEGVILHPAAFLCIGKEVPV